MSTHIDIAHQAINWFKDVRNKTDYRDIIMRHQDAFIGGNPYPDAMYSSFCFGGKFHSISEDTHWAPFLNATVRYIRRKYPKPWDQDTEKLVAFTLGFVSHQVADVTWHSLGIEQGFLTTMGDVNFFGSFPDAHSVGDPGGDMVVSFEGDTRKIPSGINEWYIPSADLENIYFDYYGEKKINKDEIELCSALMLLGWVGEKIAGAKLFSIFSKTSPFLMEDLHSYFQGGVADMAAWSVLLWHKTIDMLEHGTDVCVIPKSPLFINCNKTDHATGLKTKQSNRKLKNPGTVILQEIHKKVNLSDLNIRRTERGSYLSLSESLQAKTLNKRELSWGCRGSENCHLEVIANENSADQVPLTTPAEYWSSMPYARLGWSLVYGNFNGLNHSLVIGAPGYGMPGYCQHGRIYLVTGTTDGGLPSKDLNLDVSANMILDGMVENGRFGTGMAVVDLNRDGVDDLAVSAPSTGANDLQYTGTVYIFCGVKGKGLGAKPSLTIHGNGTYYNLGTSLLGADVDGDGFKDLIIGSPYAPEGGPQRGSVAVFLAKTQRKPESNIFVHDADWMAFGEQNYSWFGYSLAVANKNGKMLLVIAAPTFRLCDNKDCSYSKDDIQSVGRVYLFQYTLKGSPQTLATITGHKTFMKLGSSLAVGNPYNNSDDDMLAVSAMTLSLEGYLDYLKDMPVQFDQSGAIYITNLTAVLQHGNDMSIKDINYAAMFEGDRSFARFGWSLALTDVNQDGVEDLLFAAPFRTEDITEELRGAEEGELYVFYGGSSFPSGNATRGCQKIDPCPGEKASLTVKSPEERSRLGAVFLNVPSTSSSAVNLVVSSPRSSYKAFHSGSVHVLKVSTQLTSA